VCWLRVPQVLAEMCPECDISKIPRSGPSPVLIRPHELALVAPDWEVFTAWIEGNDKARDALGASTSHACSSTCPLTLMLSGQQWHP